MSKRKLLNLALENRIEELTTVDIAAPVVDDVVVEPVENVIVVADGGADLVEIATMQQDLVDTDSAIGDLAQAADQLATIRGNIEATLPNGGLTQGEAMAYQCAVNSTVANMGVQDVMPSVEQFGGGMSRKEATTVSLEAIDGVAGKVLTRAWELVKSLWAKLGEMVARVIDSFTSDVKKIDDLIKALHTVNFGGELSVTIPDIHMTALTGAGSQSPLQLYVQTYDVIGPVVTFFKSTIVREFEAITKNMVGETSYLPAPLPGTKPRGSGGVYESDFMSGGKYIKQEIPAAGGSLRDYHVSVEEKTIKPGDSIRINRSQLIELLNKVKNNRVIKEMPELARNFESGGVILKILTKATEVGPDQNQDVTAIRDVFLQTGRMFGDLLTTARQINTAVMSLATNYVSEAKSVSNAKALPA